MNLLSFCIFFIGCVYPGQFVDVTDFYMRGIPNLYLASVQWVDFDNDGLSDLFLSGTDDSMYVTQLWRQNSNGTFEDVTVEFLPGVPSIAGALSCVDFNDDGFVDILVSGYTGAERVTQLWMQHVNHSFEDVTNLTISGISGLSGPAVDWGDFNGDGLLDLLISGSTGASRISQVWRQAPGQTFEDVTGLLFLMSPPGVDGSSLQWIDFNGDGLLDIFLTGYTGSVSVTQLWGQLSNGSFIEMTDSTISGVPGVARSSVLWYDFDGDGFLDFLLTGAVSGNSGVTQLWRQLSNGTFLDYSSSIIPEAPSAWISSIARSDISEPDGLPDILLTGYPGVRKLYSMSTTRSFEDVTDLILGNFGLSHSAVSFHDFNTDGYSDLILVGRASFVEEGVSYSRYLTGLFQWFNCSAPNYLDIGTLECFFCFGQTRLGNITFCNPCSDQGLGYSEKFNACFECKDGSATNPTGAGCICPDRTFSYDIEKEICVPPSDSRIATANVAGIAGGSIGGAFAVLLIVLCCCCALMCCIILSIVSLVILFALALICIFLAIFTIGSMFSVIYFKKRAEAKFDLAAFEGYDGEEVSDGLHRDFRELAFGDLDFKEKIGEGAFGRVYLGTWRSSTAVAIKELNVIADGRAKAEFVNEANVMARIGNHPNVVHFIGAVTTEDRYYMITEFARNGSLSDILYNDSSKIQLTEVLRLFLARDAAAGVAHLHAEGIVHRDIAARNFLVSKDMTVMVADFGLSRIVEVTEDAQSAPQRTQSNVGPVRWMAPESLRSKEFSSASDVYMFGMFLYELTVREVPFNGVSVPDVFFAVTKQKARPNIPLTCAAVLAELMDLCWQEEPSRRPSMQHIYSRLALATGEKVDGPIAESDPITPVAERTSRISAEYTMTEIEGDVGEQGKAGEYFTNDQKWPQPAFSDVDGLRQKLEEKDAELRRKDKKIRKLKKKLVMSEERE